MKKTLALGVFVCLLSGCYATIGSPAAIREHYRGVNGGLEISKRQSGEKLHADRGYWASEMEQIKKWGTSFAEKWQGNSEDQAS